jgi:pimeloyl-ACP methyl ester carboxylesterase
VPSHATTVPAQLAGTLLLPLGASATARVPGIVLMHGSEVGDRGAWEYRGWGELLARQGLAVLLYDRRGSGASRPEALDARTATDAGVHRGAGAGSDQGPDASAGISFDDLAADALAAHALLAGQPQVRADRVGLLGASQSGWIAPLAAMRSREVAFLVLLSPPGVGVFEQELQRVEGEARAFEADDGTVLTDEDVAAAVAFTRALLAACRAPDRVAAFAALAPESAQARAAPWAPLVQVPESAADLDWFAAHDFDPGPTLQQLACPVLAFWGERDAIVPPALNLPPLREALERGGRATHGQGLARLRPRSRAPPRAAGRRLDLARGRLALGAQAAGPRGRDRRVGGRALTDGSSRARAARGP